jgi:hypothetical protein
MYTVFFTIVFCYDFEKWIAISAIWFHIPRSFFFYIYLIFSLRFINDLIIKWFCLLFHDNFLRGALNFVKSIPNKCANHEHHNSNSHAWPVNKRPHCQGVFEFILTVITKCNLFILICVFQIILCLQVLKILDLFCDCHCLRHSSIRWLKW